MVLGAFLYEEFPEYERFDTAELSKDQLVDWYQHRACEIERLSRQVDHALELVNLGMERGVPVSRMPLFNDTKVLSQDFAVLILVSRYRQNYILKPISNMGRMVAVLNVGHESG